MSPTNLKSAKKIQQDVPNIGRMAPIKPPR